MKKVIMKKIALLVVIIVSCLCLNGCAIGLLAAGAGYAIGAGRKGEAEKIQARGDTYEQYQGIRLQYISLNTEREKSGLEPIAIPEYDEWLNIAADKKVRKVADIEIEKEVITGKQEIEEKKRKKDDGEKKRGTPLNVPENIKKDKILKEDVNVDIIEVGKDTKDIYKDLEKLDNLRKKGILTEGEFNSEKRRLLESR